MSDDSMDPRSKYLESLRQKLNIHMDPEEESLISDDWIDGFMAAGFFGGLVTQQQLLDEYLKASSQQFDEDYRGWLEDDIVNRIDKICSGDFHPEYPQIGYKEGYGPIYTDGPTVGFIFPFVLVWSQLKERKIKAYICCLCGEPILTERGEESGRITDATAHKICLEASSQESIEAN